MTVEDKEIRMFSIEQVITASCATGGMPFRDILEASKEMEAYIRTGLAAPEATDEQV